MPNPEDITKKLKEVWEGLEERNQQIRKEQLSKYNSFLDYYKKISDESMPFVFAEFKRSSSRKIISTTGIPYETPEQMREYLAKVHTCLDSSL